MEMVVDKAAVLKARVTESLHADFLAVCEAVGSTPAAQLRLLVEDFVDRKRDYLEDDVKVHLDRPPGYDFGAWKARITLRDRTAMQWMDAPIPFNLPSLPKRRVHPDSGFAVAASHEVGHASGLDGIFVDGVWEGHVYTNGVPEAENPTPIEAVAEALRAAVAERIAAFRPREDH
jgi:hypothetical protein